MSPNTAVTKAAEQSIVQFLAKYQKQIATVLPRHLTTERVMRLVIGALNQNETLRKCTPMSVVNSVLHLATLGLEVRPKEAYLVPFLNSRKDVNGNWKKVWEAQPVIDYRGDIKLAKNGGNIRDVIADVVYSKDYFVFKQGAVPIFEHEPKLWETDADGNRIPLTEESQRGVPICAYAIGYYKDGTYHAAVLNPIEINKRRAKSKSYQSAAEKSPWTTDRDSMWKKSAVHAWANMVDQSPERVKAEAIDAEFTEVELPPLIEAAPEDDQPILDDSQQMQAATEGKTSDLEKQLQQSIKASKPVPPAGPVSTEVLLSFKGQQYRVLRHELQQFIGPDMTTGPNLPEVLVEGFLRKIGVLPMLPEIVEDEPVLDFEDQERRDNADLQAALAQEQGGRRGKR